MMTCRIGLAAHLGGTAMAITTIIGLVPGIVQMMRMLGP